MRVLVTGASGAIASAVVPELLAAGHTVIGLARSDRSAQVVEALGAQVHRGDLADLDGLSAAARNADGVIHLAFDHTLQAAGDLAGAVEADLRAIKAIGAALEGTGKPFIGTNATGALAHAGFTGVLTENDTLPGGPRIDAENVLIALASRSVRTAVIRLPPAVHHNGRYGFVSSLIDIARANGASGYVGNGRNRWPAVNTLDAARLYRLALESAPPGSRLHAVAEEGVALRDIAQAISGRVNVPSTEAAPEQFGFLAELIGLDNPVSSRATRDALGWVPSHSGLIAGLRQPTVLNVGLDPRVVGDPAAPSQAFPKVDAAMVRAGLDRAKTELAGMGLGFETCLLDRNEGTEKLFRDTVSRKHYDVILIGAGVRLDPSMTPLFEKLIGIARTHAPESALCFNTSPNSIVEAVQRVLPNRAFPHPS
ncbi:SDR family oxidoreductase [Dactylosporangium sp. CA-092794]|uniref:SDR family oxidoreductase n=1 Tax=Dactylosporangium sp. CA-092794 TaxID=3239929 RepID=UPI003D93C914